MRIKPTEQAFKMRNALVIGGNSGIGLFIVCHLVKEKYDKLFVGLDYRGLDLFKGYEKILSGNAEIIYFPYFNGTINTQIRNVIKKNDGHGDK